VGGIAIVTAVFVGLAVARVTGAAPLPRAGTLAAGAAAVAGLSLVDDLRPLPALLRLAGHVAVAVLVVTALGPWPIHPAIDTSPLVTLGLGALWLVGLVNAYNFMDGIDGLAGGQAVVAATGWTIVGVVTGVPALTGLGLVVAVASAAFLRFNWPPARVFMGDTGSSFLGYAFAVMPFAAAASPRLFAAAALFVWPFVFDTTLTFVRRLARGENVVKAHRTHLYQRLVSTGLSHRSVSLAYLALAALGLPAGISAAAGSWPLAGASGLVVAIAALALWRAVLRREAATARWREGAAARPVA
jgi:UDP-N-acetylmuramyl pentapeptide phosphotransferase/UDP-N-acetylglucosamine-1-phosphate transferase